MTAAPWQYLSDEDLIEVESPPAPAGWHFALVLGNAGHTFGLAFYASREQHEAMMDVASPSDVVEVMDETMPVARSVLFDPPDTIPIKDHDLWLEHHLPVAGPRAYPFPAIYHGPGSASRLAREELEFAEAVLRALAVTTEDEMDSGRWSKGVTAGGRKTTLRLALPGLLDPGQPGAHVGIQAQQRSFERIRAETERFLRSHEFASLDEANTALAEHFANRPLDEIASTAQTPAERAQDLAYQAYDSIGRRRVVLAREALALWPDCAEAYVILAEYAPRPEQSLPLYQEAVAAGGRALGEDLEKHAGELWGHVQARPYLRARLGLAYTLEALGRGDEAIEHLQDVLRLNVHDNQGVRYLLLPRLLQHGRRGEAADILEAYPDDAGATLSVLPGADGVPGERRQRHRGGRARRRRHAKPLRAGISDAALSGRRNRALPAGKRRGSHRLGEGDDCGVASDTRCIGMARAAGQSEAGRAARNAPSPRNGR